MNNHKSEYLDIISSLVSFDESELNLIKNCSEVKKYSKGKLLLKEGDHSDSIIFITKGLLREYYRVPQDDANSFDQVDLDNPYEDNTYTSWIMAEGNFVYNVKSFLEGAPSKCFIRAEEDVIVITTSKPDFGYLLETIPGICKLVRLLQEKALLEYERRLELLREKDTLLRYQKFIDVYPGLQHRVSLKNIATYLNISPRHLSRIRSSPLKK